MKVKVECSVCGKKVYRHRAYEWKGQIFGIECFKKHALPKILEERKKRQEAEEQEWYEQCWGVIEVARTSDTKSAYKQRVYADLAKWFEEKGYLTKKQYQLLIDLFSTKDMLKLNELKFQLGWKDEKDYLEYIAEHATGKQQREAVKEMYEKGYITKDEIVEEYIWRFPDLSKVLKEVV